MAIRKNSSRAGFLRRIQEVRRARGSRPEPRIHLFEQLEDRRLLAVASLPDQLLPVPQPPVYLSAGNVSSSQSADLINVTRDGGVVVALNADSNAWLSTVATQPVTGPVLGATTVLLNADGFDDLLLRTSTELLVLNSDGAGGWLPGQQVGVAGVVDPTTHPTVTPVVGYLGSDLAIDLVLPLPQSDQIAVLRGAGMPGFHTPVYLDTGGSQPIAVAVGDLIGGPQADVIVGHADGQLTFLEGDTDGSLVLRGDLAVPTSIGSISDLKVADLDSDGHLEVVATGTGGVVLLSPATDPLAASPISNGDFDSGLTGWQAVAIGQPPGAQAGRVQAGSGFAQFTEHESFLTSLSQTFVVPDNPQTIQFNLLALGLDAVGGQQIPDAFEVSLLNESSASLVQAHVPNSTAFVNFVAGESMSASSQVVFDGSTVSLDISAITPGTSATLVFDLIGNPNGIGSSVAIDSVRITPAVVRDDTFSISSLAGPFGTPESLAIGDVDGDGNLDLVVADSGTAQVIVFNGDGAGGWSREVIETGGAGAPSALALGPFTAPDHVLDIAVGLSNQAALLTPLVSDTSVPTAQLLAPDAGGLITLGTVESAAAALSSIVVQFSEAMFRPDATTPGSATNPASYLFYNFGPNGLDEGAAGDDVIFTLASASYNEANNQVTLSSDPVALSDPRLAAGSQYRVVALGSDPATGLRDLAGRLLEGGQDSAGVFTLDRSPQLSGLSSSSNVEGQAIDLSLLLEHYNFDRTYTATVNWGDGTSTAIVGSGAFPSENLASTHVYADDGAYQVAVSVADGARVVASTTATIAVNNDPPKPVAAAPSSSQEGESKLFTLATFSDAGFSFPIAGTSETFSATIDWDDGSPLQTLGVFATNGGPDTATTGLVQAVHAYANDGAYFPVVTLRDDDGGENSVTAQVNVANTVPLPTQPPPIGGSEGSERVLTFTATDAGVDDLLSASVDWGDDTTSPANASFDGTRWLFTASHFYGDDGNYRIVATVADDLDRVDVEASATITSEPPTVSAVPASATVGRQLTISSIQISDPAFANGQRQETFTASIDWGDGMGFQPASVINLVPGTPGIPTSAQVYAQHVFSSAGVYSAQVIVTDDEGASGSATFRIVVEEPATSADAWLPTLDFELNAAGFGLASGDIVSDQWSNWGVQVTTHDPVRHPPMIFDSSEPTGRDEDLGSPNHSFGGPGEGSGGAAGAPAENPETLGNILIISEDADSSDPDDNAAGGTFIFTFENPVMVDDLRVLDIEQPETVHFRWFDALGDLIADQTLSGVHGSNGHQTAVLNARGVSRLEVEFSGSGAITDIVFCRDLTGDEVTLAGPPSSQEGRAYELDLNANGLPVESWTINWGDGTSQTLAGFYTRAEHIFGDGPNDTKIRAFAQVGNSVVAAEPMSLSVVNVIPALTISGDREVQAGQQYTLELFSSDPGQDTLQGWLIDWGDGTEPQLVWGSPNQVVHTYTTVGDLVIRAHAFDEDTDILPDQSPFDSTWVANTLAVTVTADPNRWLPKIDFERAADGSALLAGDRITDQFASLGLTVSTSDPQRPAMIFNSVDPTGGDKDLGTPNSKFGGAGKGKGGAGGRGANAHPLGNILIISEDNDASDPDDSAAGGTLIFEFDSPVMMDEVHLLDIENDQTHVRLLAADGTLINDLFALDLGDNSFQVLALEATGVSRMEIVLAGSGAVAAVVSCREGAPIPPPPTRFFVVDKSDKAAYRYSAEGGSIGEFSIDKAGSPRGAATTGAGNPMWVVTSSKQVLVYDTDGESLLGSWRAKTVSSPEGIATNGTDIWIVDKSKDRIYRFEDAAGRRSGSQEASASFQLANGNKNPTGLTTDGQFLWVVDKSSDKVFVYDVNGNWINWWNLDQENSDPSGVTIDPGQDGLWVVDSKDDRVFSYTRRTLDEQGSQAASSSFPLAKGNTSPEGIADPAIMIEFGQVVSSTTGDGQYSFSAVAGQEVIVSFSEARGALTSTLTAPQPEPDGTIVYSAFGFSPVNHNRGPLILEQTGDYILNLSGGSRFTFTVVEVPEPTDYAYTLGTLTTGTTGAPFGTDNYVFSGTANQEVFLRWDDISGPAGVSLFAPDGSLVATGGGAAEANLNLGWITLPADGEYKLSVSSPSDLTYTFVLADVPDTRVFQTSLGDEVSQTLPSIGARDHWLLEATAGERYYFDMSSIEGGWLRAKLVAPDGQVVSNRLDFVTSNHDFGPLLFDQTGTYRLELSDDTGGVPSYELRFWPVPDPDERVVELGQITFGSIETPGRSDLFTFDGSQGQLIYLDMQQIRSALGGTQALVTELVSPSGNVLFSITDALENAHDIGPYELSEDGTYAFRFSGRGDNVANFQFRVADVTPEAAVPIAMDEIVTGGISAGGEVRSYSFAATAGESLTLDVIFNQGFAPITPSSLGFTVVSPSGTALVTSSINDAPLNIAETGVHTLIVDDATVPNSGDDTGRYSFRITADPNSPLPPAADLRVSAVSATRKAIGDSAAAPAELTVTWIVTNDGPGTAQVWNDQILFSSEDSAGGLSMRAVAEIPNVTVLGSGESYQQTAIVALPEGLEGELWVYVEPDARNTVFEAADEYTGTARAVQPTVIYAAARPLSGSPAITLSPEDGSRYPAGSTLTLAGNAASSKQSVNAIFVVDISASTLSPTGLDANFDGVVDELDDLNNDGQIGSVLDTEIAATLRVVEQLSSLTDDLRVATILFAGDSQPLDAGPGDFNQVFVDPLDASYEGDKNTLPNFEYALRSLWAQSSTFVNRQGAFYFRDLELASGTQFNPAVRNIDSLLQSAQAADRTLVYMLTDGQATDAAAIDVAGVADQGIEFYAFQIGDRIITPELDELAIAIDSDPSSTGRVVAVENPEDLTTQLLTTLGVESVTVNGSPVTALDPAGNFFAAVRLTPGENTFEVNATSVTGRQTTETLTLFGEELGPVIESSSLVPSDSGLAARFSGTTFNRQSNQLHTRLQVSNDATQAVVAPIVAVAEDVALSPAVAVSSPDTVIDGAAAWIFDSEVASGLLPPSQASDPVGVAFDNPLRDRLQPAVVFLGPSATAPVFTSVPELIAPVGAEYTYAASVLDLDGDSSQFALQQAPNGMTLNSSTGKLSWSPTASDIGHHAVRLVADDGRGGTAEQQFTLLVPEGIPNNPPLILTQPPASFATVDEPFTYTIASIDPDGDPVRLSLDAVSVGSGTTSGVVLTGNTLSWTPTSLDVGSASIEIVATDPTGAAGTQRLYLRVLEPNLAPAFVSTPLDTVSAGQIYRYLARATDTEDAILYSLVSGPASMSIDADSGLVTWQPETSDIGTSTTVVLRATDARGLATDQAYDLIAAPDTQRPQVSIQLAQAVIDQGDTVEIQVFARDNVVVSAISLSVDGVPLSLDALGRATYVSTAPGLLAVEVTATDDSGNIGSALTSLRVIDPTDTTPPVITIDSPSFGQRITYLTDLIGSVNADDLESFEVAYALAGSDEYTTFYTGTSSVSGGVLATFDPTLLANDIYDIRVSAQDTNGNIRRETMEVSVEANAKLGNFRLEFTDLNIPLAGIPIQINRIYDTLAAPYSQDFGFGWSLDVASPRIRETVRISESEAAGAGIFGANPFRTGTRVYLNAPDGRRVGFTFDPVPEPGLLGAIWRPRFTADPGVYHRLEVDDVPLSQSADGTFGTYLTGFAYNPDSYTLVTKDQHRYRYHQFDDIQLQSITNRNNVTLTFDDTGIHSSIGPEITWTRDALGRITQIVDPMGHVHTYSYNASGDLSVYSNAVQDEVTFEYLSEPAHYLSKITDARGNDVMSLGYDESGRLVANKDALGHVLPSTYDLAANLEIIGDRSGNNTSLHFDERGNVVSITDPLGNQQSMQYDSGDNLTSYVDAEGYTTTMTYDGRGNLLSVTDPLGNSKTYVYDEFNNATHIIDALGRKTVATFDSGGDLIRTLNARGDTTSVVRDAYGRQTSYVDQFGHATLMEYDTATHMPSRVVWPDGASRQYSVNMMGMVTRSVDENGNVTEYAYDAAGKMVSMKDEDGQSISLSYEADLVSQMVDQLGRVTGYAYDSNGLLTTHTDAAGNQMTYVRDADGRVVEEIDPEGRSVRYTYDAVGHRTRMKVNPTYEYKYDVRGKISAAFSETGAVTRYDYDELGRIKSITSPAGRKQTYTYDAVGNVVRLTDDLGTTRFGYDVLDRLTQITDPLGITESWVYDAAGNITSYTDGEGNTWTASYDNRRDHSCVRCVVPIISTPANARRAAQDQLIELTDPLGNSTIYTYDRAANLLSETDALGRAYEYTYDAQDRLVSATDPLAQVTTWSYDLVGNLASTTNARGHTTTYRYDAVDNLSQIENALGEVTSFSYDGNDNLTAVTDPAGNTTSYVLDALDRVIETRDALGQSVFYGYDADSNLLSYTDETDHVWLWEYDLDGLNTRAIMPDGGVHEFDYDGVGLLTAERDPLGRETQYVYDAGSRLVEQIDASGARLQFAYDDRDLLVRVEDGLSNVRTYGYDAVGRQTRETDPRGLSTLYSYDAVGNLTGKTDRLGRQTNYTYDSLDRLTEERWLLPSGDRGLQYRYDAVGNLIAADDPDSQYAFQYDALDRVIQSDNLGTPVVPRVVMSYAYDTRGNPTGTSDQFGTQIVAEFDELNRVSQLAWSGGGVDPVHVEMDYNARSGLSQLRRYDDAGLPELIGVSDYVFDAKGRMTSVSHQSGSGTVLSEFSYVYDPADQLIQSTERGLVRDFGYDQRGQLTSVDAPGGIQEQYAYDAAGNREAPEIQVSAGNLLESDGIHDFEYDAEGNLIRQTRLADGRVTEYAYDYRNRLTSVTISAAGGAILSEVSYVYDVFDRKIIRNVDGQVQSTVYTGNRAWADFDAAGQVVAKYMYGDEGVDHLLARHRPGEGTAWYLQDRLFSVRDVVDASGAVIDSIDYDSFGNILSESDGGAGDRFKYTGREWEAAVGLYYYRARHYDPAVGRFITEDSWGLAAGDPNYYRYVGNAPTGYIDPSGHVAVSDYAVALAGVVGFLLSGGVNCVTDTGALWTIGVGIPFTDIQQGIASGLLEGPGVPTPRGLDVEIVSCALLTFAAWSNGVFAELSTVLTLIDATQQGSPFDCVSYRDEKGLNSISDYAVFVRASCGGSTNPIYVVNDSMRWELTTGYADQVHSNCFIAGTHVLVVEEDSLINPTTSINEPTAEVIGADGHILAWLDDYLLPIIVGTSLGIFSLVAGRSLPISHNSRRRRRASAVWSDRVDDVYSDFDPIVAERFPVAASKVAERSAVGLPKWPNAPRSFPLPHKIAPRPCTPPLLNAPQSYRHLRWPSLGTPLYIPSLPGGSTLVSRRRWPPASL